MFELQPRANSRHCFGVLVNNVCTAISYNTVRSLEKYDYIFTYERVLKKETGESICNSIYDCRFKACFIFTMEQEQF